MDDVIDSSPDTLLGLRMHATTQCELEHVHAVYAQVLLGKRPLAIVQVAEGNHHKSVCVIVVRMKTTTSASYSEHVE